MRWGAKTILANKAEPFDNNRSRGHQLREKLEANINIERTTVFFSLKLVGLQF
jgi:hypothetical protein